MPTTQIGDTDLTIEWLTKIIQDYFKTTNSISNFSVEEIGDGRGFLSQILQLKIDWKPESTALPQSLVLKVPSTAKIKKAMDDFCTDEMKAEMGDTMESFNVVIAHKCECAVYGIFGKNKPSFDFPKCYYSREISNEQDGVLVLEDLSDGTRKTITEGITLNQAKSIAEALACLHAYSLTSNDWKSPAVNVTFDKMMSNDQPMEKAMQLMCEQMKKEWPEYFDPLIDSMVDLCKTKDDYMYIYTLAQELKLPEVMVHGDLWISNMIFETQKDGEKDGKLKALIDWQISHPGCMTEDFARLFTSSASADLRRNHAVEILGHYYNHLTEKLGHQPPYTLDQVINAYKRSYKFGAMCIIPAFMMFIKQDAMLGDTEDERERNRKVLLSRCRALIEDLVTYENNA